MTWSIALLSRSAGSPLASAGIILAAMALVAMIEVAVPLHARGRWHRAHLGPNLALTFITFATNALFSVGLVLALTRLAAVGFGVLPLLAPPPLLAAALAVVALDFSFYVAHVAMHRVPAFWRFHRVHHCDAAVDVTTTIRQHPGESVIRYAFMAVCAIGIGATPAAFAVYRLASALAGLLEHANLRAPAWLDRALALVTSFPHLHKVHHSRDARETDTNYGNLLSLFDRLFGTFTPSARGTSIAYGLAGFDDEEAQTTARLLALPFRVGPDAAGTNSGELRVAATPASTTAK
jgi:sterol desaturase/sphingolipid hydroxylase (fatty acid hydroxylase superfamily)